MGVKVVFEVSWEGQGQSSSELQNTEAGAQGA
jgi:hypothetical protein